VPPHALAATEVVARLETHSDRGLTGAEADVRLARFGRNELAEAPPPSAWRKIAAQVAEPVILILLAAAALSAGIGQWADALAILAIVVLNALLGLYQEQRAERALAALRRLSAPVAKAVRDGRLQAIPARELVPGDRIELEAGDYIPADARLLSATALRVQEAALTGESESVEKNPGVELDAATPLGDRRNMAYLGTVVAAGKASAVVTATGMQTELGRIAGMLQHYDREPTPLQRRLSELGRVISIGCLVLAAVIFALELAHGTRLTEVLLLAVSLAVAAVPEGLPAVVTVALTLGLQRMARRNALIRKLPSVETLGSVTVICSDKTGTLTRNEMTVREAVLGDRHYLFTGAGYAPHGQILTADGTRPVEPAADTDLTAALAVAAWCNAARLLPRGDGEGWQVIGDPTEGALLVAARKGGVEPPRRADVLWEIPFDSERKAMSVAVRGSPGQAVMYTKGAPEVVLGKCAAERRHGRAEPLTADRRAEITRSAAEMAARALRVLALAYREGVTPDAPAREEDLVFAGLVGMMDPPREEAKEAVPKCHEAGIRPVVITGDHPATALAVARELGIARGDDQAMTGAELDGLTDDQLTGRVGDIAVYARVSAEHKLRVVRAWQQTGQVVAMTGDGVNDAPAVRAADIGIAMGATGTDVTREASAMVLTDDNFASIVNAVEEGRGVYDNIRKFLHYLLAGNAGLILFVLLASALGWPFPLTATQILWMNLVTNGLPALALGMEPPERDIMRRKPRPPREPILTIRRGLRIAAHGLLVAAVTAVGFGLVYDGTRESLPRARTMAFCVVSFGFIFYSLGCRSFRRTMPELGLFTNPALLAAITVSCLLQLSVVTLPFARPVFETAAHFGWEWGLLLLLALTPVTLIEVAKLIRARLWPPDHQADATET
jgi:Ca2+-transporting ATPase